MLNNLIKKYGVVNPDISDAEVFDLLSERFKHIRIANKSSSRTLKIVARSGLGKMTIGRARNGSFKFDPEVAGIYVLLTLGLAEVFGGFAGRREFKEIIAFMRERIHLDGALR